MNISNGKMVWGLLVLFNLIISTVKHGDPKGEYDAIFTFVASIIEYFFLSWVFKLGW